MRTNTMGLPALLLAMASVALGCGTEFSSGSGGAGAAQPIGGSAGSAGATTTISAGGAGATSTIPAGGAGATSTTTPTGPGGAGGAGPEMGPVDCPEAPCQLDKQCCAANLELSCTPAEESCPGGVIGCDEIGDCPPDRVCCFDPIIVAASCSPAGECTKSELECTKDADCPGGSCCFLGTTSKCRSECQPTDLRTCVAAADCDSEHCCPIFGGLYSICALAPCSDI